MIKSHVLYRLSYRGKRCVFIALNYNNTVGYVCQHFYAKIPIIFRSHLPL